MKKTLFTIVALVATAAATFALDPGTFALSSAKGTKPKVLKPDSTVAAGTDYLIDVQVLNPTTGNFESPTAGAIALPTSLKTGGNAGLFSAGTITVPFVAAGADATIKILAWDKTTGATFADAAANGISGSATFHITLGGVIDANGLQGLPNDIVPAFTGITLSSAVVQPPLTPEPSTYALLALGVGSLLFFRRK